MKKDLLVTLADANFINQSKQLFSSVYHNGGWRGDYMLFAHEIPDEDLKWFADKGIFVKKCRPIPHTEGLENIKRPRCVFSKFYLMSPELKEWKNVVFLDSDIIVRASLDKLTRIEGFAAANATGINLKKCFLYPERPLHKKLAKEYSLTGKAFNSGIMAFNTDVIKRDSFDKLVEFMRIYGSLNFDGDEPTFNLLFYKNWAELPWAYNIYPIHLEYSCRIKPERMKGIILHFVASRKPWEKQSPFHEEWTDNLRKSELIDLESRPAAKEVWTNRDIKRYIRYLKLRIVSFYILVYADRFIGLAGIFIKKHDPDLYFKLKRKFFKS